MPACFTPLAFLKPSPQWFCRFFPLQSFRGLEECKIDGYVPDSNLGRSLNRDGPLRQRACDAVHRRMRQKLRDPVGRAIYGQRKAIVEPVNGVLKEQRGMRRFRQRGLTKVAVEWTRDNHRA